MTIVNILILIFLIISSILTIIFVVLVNHFKDKNDNLSFLNSYPYEYFLSMSFSKRISLYIIFFLDLLIQATLTFTSLFLLNTTAVYLIIISFISIFAFILFSIGFVTPLSYLKQHIICIISSFLLFMSYNVLLSFVTIINENFKLNFSITILILIGVIGFLSLISFINPNLSKFAKLNKSEDNGKTIYVKPKINSLPLYEWIYFILFQLSTILISINGIINIRY